MALVQISRGDGTPLVIIPGIARTPFSMIHLAKACGAARHVYIYSYSGMEEGEAVHGDVDAIAIDLAGELNAIWPLEGWALCGDCFGGLVACRAARMLMDGHQTPPAVVLIDTIFPASGKNPEMESESKFLTRLDSLGEATRERMTTIWRTHSAAARRARLDRMNLNMLYVSTGSNAGPGATALWQRLFHDTLTVLELPECTLRPPGKREAVLLAREIDLFIERQLPAASQSSVERT